jgi:itaconyl-CoA hydratase
LLGPLSVTRPLRGGVRIHLYQRPLGLAVTETDNTWFTLLATNTNQAHFNAEVGAASALDNSAPTASPTPMSRTPFRTQTPNSRSKTAGLAKDNVGPS